MFFRKRDKIKKHAKKFDRLVTWLIIWGAVASVVWLSKTNKWKEITKNIKKEWVNISKKCYSVFWKCLVWVVRIFNKK